MDFGPVDGELSATLEHIKPRSLGGADDHPNLRLAHKRCNCDRSYPPPRRTRSPFYEPLKDLA